MKGNKRKTAIIDRKTQFLIALEVMLHALILPMMIFLFLAIDPFSTIFSNRSPEAHFEAVSQLVSMNIGKLPIFFLLILFVGLLSIVFSNHIAGPAFRFVKTMKAVLDKDLTDRIILRKWDYLKNVSSEMNLALDNLNKDLRDIKEAGHKISKAAQAIAAQKSGFPREAGEIEQDAKKISEIIDGYKLS
jgi:methyl-accepting chemotaxis protein